MVEDKSWKINIREENGSRYSTVQGTFDDGQNFLLVDKDCDGVKIDDQFYLMGVVENAFCHPEFAKGE